jgi:thiamine kinase-like enzyme
MKCFSIIGVFFFLSCLSAAECESREKLCEKIMKELLKIEESVQIKKMQGGLNGAELFFAHFDDKNYVIRFLAQDTLQERKREILACTIASEEKYGPKVYLADADQGFIVMEHLKNELPQEDEILMALANLAKRIHSRLQFPYSRNFFDQITGKIDEYLGTQKAQMECIPKDWLERLTSALQEIRQAADYYPHTALCHRDLHKQNLFFSNGCFIAIDYEMAAQDDPFVDLAMITVSYDLNSEQAKFFLASYLGHKPNVQEESKLFLYEQAVRIFWGFCLIALVPDGTPELQQSLAKREAKIASYRTPDGQLTNAAIRMRHALSNFNSQEYQEALKLLGYPQNH